MSKLIDGAGRLVTAAGVGVGAGASVGVGLGDVVGSAVGAGTDMAVAGAVGVGAGMDVIVAGAVGSCDGVTALGGWAGVGAGELVSAAPPGVAALDVPELVAPPQAVRPSSATPPVDRISSTARREQRFSTVM